jgi:hypothetical protein
MLDIDALSNGKKFQWNKSNCDKILEQDYDVIFECLDRSQKLG